MKAKKRMPNMNIIKQIEKDAVAQMDAVRRIVEPTIRQFEATRQAVLNPYKDIKLTPDMIMSHPITAGEMDGLFKKHAQPATRTSRYDILFNRVEKSLKRHLGEKPLAYKFGRGKRFKLFNILDSLDQDEYVPTKLFVKMLECKSIDAFYKLVEGVNTKARVNLELGGDVKLIEGRDGEGYRINPKFNVHKE